MDIGAVVEWLRGEWAVITQAPISFTACVILAAFVIWKVVQREFSVRLANADSTVSMLKEKLERSEVSEALTHVAASQARDEDRKPAVPAVISKKQPRPSGKKEYIREGETLENLMGIFTGRTELTANRMLSDQIGKWVVIEGPVSEVAELPADNTLVLLSAGQFKNIGCMFKSAPEPVINLRLGSTVKIEGRITKITEFTVYLDQCELLA